MFYCNEFSSRLLSHYKIFVNQFCVTRKNNVIMSRKASQFVHCRQRKKISVKHETISDTCVSHQIIFEFSRHVLIYRSKIHDMHIYVNLNSFGANKIKVLQRHREPFVRRKFRHARSHTVTLSHEQESTISCLSRARQRSHYANSINSFAVSDTRIKGIDAVGHVWNTLFVSPSDTREYLREVLLVADTSPITL